MTTISAKRRQQSEVGHAERHRRLHVACERLKVLTGMNNLYAGDGAIGQLGLFAAEKIVELLQPKAVKICETCQRAAAQAIERARESLAVEKKRRRRRRRKLRGVAIQRAFAKGNASALKSLAVINSNAKRRGRN